MAEITHTKQHTLSTLQRILNGSRFTVSVLHGRWYSFLSWTILSDVFCMPWIHFVTMTVGCCFVTTKQNSLTNISAYIRKKTPPFLYLLKNVHYSCFISINIYKEAFCKWTSIAYMLVRMDSPRDFIVSCILYYCIIVVFLLFKSWFGNIFGGWVFGPAHQTHS